MATADRLHWGGMVDLTDLKRRVCCTPRLKTLPAHNSAVVRAMGSDLLTIRVDLD